MNKTDKKKNLLKVNFISAIIPNIETIAEELKQLFIPYCEKTDLDDFFNKMLDGIYFDIDFEKIRFNRKNHHKTYEMFRDKKLLARLEKIYNWIQSELIKVKTLINEGKKIDLNPLINQYFFNDIEKILDHNCFKIVSPQQQVEAMAPTIPNFDLLNEDLFEDSEENLNLSQTIDIINAVVEEQLKPSLSQVEVIAPTIPNFDLLNEDLFEDSEEKVVYHKQLT